jgi:hypothetical protein
MYALAASAAGVGVLALAQPAEAKIVYTHIHYVIWPYGAFPLDLNNDGVPDFILSNSGISTGGRASVCPASGTLGRGCQPNRSPNAVWGTFTKRNVAFYASALPANFNVGANGHFRSRAVFQLYAWGCNSSSCEHQGPWHNVHDRYLGFKFIIDGQIHYGWARLSVQHVYRGIYDTLTGYAYETIPGKAIVTGQTHDSAKATLGQLARGAGGTKAWRTQSVQAVR